MLKPEVDDLVDQLALTTGAETMNGVAHPELPGVVEVEAQKPTKRLRTRKRRDKDGKLLGMYLEPGPGLRITSVYFDLPAFDAEEARAAGRVGVGRIAILTAPSRGGANNVPNKKG